jgi:hypothetical protein
MMATSQRNAEIGPHSHELRPSVDVMEGAFSYKEGSSGLKTSLVRKVGRELSPRGNGRILASKEVLRCTWLLLL